MWNVLNEDDVTGNVRKALSSDSDNFNKIKGALRNATRNAAVSDIVGSSYAEKVYDGRVVGLRQTVEPVTRGFARGILVLNILEFSAEVWAFGLEGAVNLFVDGMLEMTGMNMNVCHQTPEMVGYSECLVA